MIENGCRRWKPTCVRLVLNLVAYIQDLSPNISTPNCCKLYSCLCIVSYISVKQYLSKGGEYIGEVHGMMLYGFYKQDWQIIELKVIKKGLG